jgi:hypothetical protein
MTVNKFGGPPHRKMILWQPLGWEAQCPPVTGQPRATPSHYTVFWIAWVLILITVLESKSFHSVELIHSSSKFSSCWDQPINQPTIPTQSRSGTMTILKFFGSFLLLLLGFTIQGAHAQGEVESVDFVTSPSGRSAWVTTRRLQDDVIAYEYNVVAVYNLPLDFIITTSPSEVRKCSKGRKKTTTTNEAFPLDCVYR